MIFGLKRARRRNNVRKPPRSAPRDKSQPVKKRSPVRAFRRGGIAIGGPQFFDVRTRLAKSSGTDKRYKLNAIRALPAKKKDTVVLQATDGNHAVCVLTRGKLDSSRLVPSQVLPTRKGSDEVMIALAGDHWRSSDGKSVEDRYQGESSFPSFLDVLPNFNTQPESSHIRLGVDLTLLNKVADSLGTNKVTLFIPLPRKVPGAYPGNEPFVNKPIAVCPATEEADASGIGVVMPLLPKNGTGYFMRIRKQVAQAEARLASKANARTIKNV